MKIARIISNLFGVEFIIVNIINNKNDIQDIISVSNVKKCKIMFS
jgi:hypothetical protein